MSDYFPAPDELRDAYINDYDLGFPLDNPEPTDQTSQAGQTSRAEHLAWCKRRALEYCDVGDIDQAFASMTSDLGNHPETANHAGIQLGMMMLMAGHISTPEKMSTFIKGFN